MWHRIEARSRPRERIGQHAWVRLPPAAESFAEPVAGALVDAVPLDRALRDPALLDPVPLAPALRSGLPVGASSSGRH
ncbi:MAG: hypothetical protein JWO98_1335 [Frankiales bacterium]|nr:hypothetical protein [Frankiales bacterium]